MQWHQKKVEITEAKIKWNSTLKYDNEISFNFGRDKCHDQYSDFRAELGVEIIMGVLR